jgi:chemotaxis protein methyltransferase CheR
MIEGRGMTLSQSDFDYVRHLVRGESAIVLEQEKQYLVEARLSSLAQREGLGSVPELVGRLRQRPDEALTAKVVEAMTTTETYFFRDHKPFEALRREVLPALTLARAATRRLRIWSAACSTGQEAYSLGIVVHELFAARPDWDVQILATDINGDVLARAREGSYGQLEVNRGLPAAMLVRYFTQHGGQWRIKEEVRRLLRFELLNLTRPWPTLPPMDVIFLRNVMIYFDLPTKQQILARVRRVLRPDGYLFLGGSETTLNVDDGFVREELAGTSCYRPRGPAPLNQ